MNKEDVTPYKCRLCGGAVLQDTTNKNWKVYKCSDCKSQAPLSPEDMMKVMGK